MDTIEAIRFLNADDPITTIAETLALAVTDRINKGDSPVIVSMRGMRGVPSSFFNAMLIAIRSQCGAGALDQVAIEFDSDIQRKTFERTREVVQSM